jgi:hypothetical protein
MVININSFKNFIIVTLIIILIFLNYSNLNYFFPQSKLSYSDKKCKQRVYNNNVHYRHPDIDDINNIYDKENNNIMNDPSSNIIGTLPDNLNDVIHSDPSVLQNNQPIYIDNHLSNQQNYIKPINELPINSNAIDDNIVVSNLSDHELIHIENTKPFHMHDDISIVNTVENNKNDIPLSNFNYLKKFSKNFHYCNSDDIYSKY